MRPLARALCLGVLLPCALLVSAPAEAGDGEVVAAPLRTLKERSEEAEQRVELNSASVEELCTLPGIGPKKAEAIIAFRERRPFTRVTQLLRIKGIGMRTLERMRPLIYVAPLQRSGPAEAAKAPSTRGTQPTGEARG